MKKYCIRHELCNCTRNGVQFRDCRKNYRGKSRWRQGLIIAACVLILAIVVLHKARVI